MDRDVGPRSKVGEEEARQHPRHLTTAPPGVEAGDDLIVVVWRREADRDAHFGRQRSMAASISREARISKAGTLATTIWNPCLSLRFVCSASAATIPSATPRPFAVSATCWITASTSGCPTWP